ncbi:MAG: selenocysteine-specific translation elongation factor [Synergistaceae bacterium]|jgi:selenocysteine-specific elongation factor|nr:selenocysteine-specific translation elongation factor [Synergistaceae bacterium]
MSAANNMNQTAKEREISLVIGTAGHIDHGKTKLVAALTGVDCDRLLEEKKRGITIELGFAPLRLEDGRVVSIIDVPGHERFIRQMVAGASGVDAVMLIVAADESVMPQTREHLAILELLGVGDGLVVITKTDRIEPGLLELVEEDVRAFVRGTFLEGKAVVPVSALTGENIDSLRRELTALVDRVRPRSRKGAFFLPVDRAFPIAGFGTVVTGTAYRGIARPGDEVEIFPAGREGKIRTLQVHSRTVEEAFAGQRVAVNLAGISVDELSRGDVVCYRGVYASTRCFDAMVKLLASAPDPLKHWQRVHLCIGTSDVLARISLTESRSIPPGGEAPAQVVIEEPIVCTAGQRFILRFYSPLITLGGGRVVFPYAHKPRGADMRRAAAERIRALSTLLSAGERFAFLVEQAGMLPFNEASRAIQAVPSELSALAADRIEKGQILELKGDRPVYLSQACFGELARNVKKTLKTYHNAHPSEAGMSLDELARAALKTLDGKAARSLLTLLAEKKEIIAEEGRARLSDFTPGGDDVFQKNSDALFALCRQRGYQPPTLEETRAELGMDPRAFANLIQSLKNSRRLVLLSGEYLLTDEMENGMMNVLERIGGDVTLAAVRDATNSSRKFILPILEYFDSKGYTRRVGDVRVVRKAVK